ncbi:hypothetical protein EDC01DRAFT_718861 [Geopyxis carbonaria]|nr:hypothetical protein EDC01DRAFT_718861 [Geopyxis carbonaria]
MSISSNRDSFHPQFASSLSYATVRDFAYSSVHPLHYGPTINSGLSTPAGSQRESGYMESGSEGSNWFTGGGSGYRRLSDPAVSSMDTSWGDSNVYRQRHANQPPPLNFSDGPPWSEDEDLQSPVVLPNPGPVHRKHKSTSAHTHTRGQSKNVFTPTTLQHPGSRDDEDRGEYGNGQPGSSYHTTTAGGRDIADGEPGGELYNHQEETEYNPDNPDHHQYNPDSDDEGREFDDDYNSRFSRDYQFTIASPAEEVHGKAVALFDFIQENPSELPLREGQVIWVSYWYGMGWLVAEDPKTGLSGLVPEEYVRLLRDMHPPYTSQGSEMSPSALMPEAASMDADTPTSPGDGSSRDPAHISTSSTSSADPHPYPHQLRAEGAHLETPTANNHQDRIEQIRREQERAVVEEEGETPRLRSDTFEPRANGDIEVRAVRANGDDEFHDAPESQGTDSREPKEKI